MNINKDNIMARGLSKDGIEYGIYLNMWKDNLITNAGYIEIDPKSIGEYIGWKDISGNPIFTGDIVVLNTPEEEYLVIFDTATLSYKLLRNNMKFKFYDWMLKCIKIVRHDFD